MKPPAPKLAADIDVATREHRAGRLPEAIAAYRRVLASDPRNPDITQMLALALHQSGNDQEAIPLFNRALMLDPGNVNALRNLLELWRRQGNWEKVLECARKLSSLRPNDPEMRMLLAGALAQAGRFDEAAPVYHKLLESQPHNIQAQHALAEIYRLAKKFPQAEAEFAKLVRRQPNDVQAWVGLGDALRWQYKMEPWLAASQRAVQIDPNSVDALHLLGWALLDLARPREALPLVERAIHLSPREPRLYWLRGFILLMLGEYQQGWNNYESRWEVTGLNLKRPSLARPQWRGEDIRGKSLYLFPEQGLGDTLQFIRYAPLILERGAKDVFLVVPPEVESLLARSMPGIKLLHHGDPLPQTDFQCPIMSLPLAFGTTLENVPAKVPYLTPDPLAVAKWKERLAQYPGVKVGLAWAGRPTNPNDFHRSTTLQKLRGLAGVPGIQFVSLQKGYASAQVKEIPELGMLDWTEELTDFADTAALVGALDHVVSICTSITHLSGALGKPTWTILSYTADFRWMLDREDSPWYPSIRLFRQPEYGDWESVVQNVRKELIDLP
jgi:Flp pilus assembly protein TadD